MNARLRRRLERAERVRDFFRAHLMKEELERAALARLEALIERAQVLATQQRTGVAVTRAATKQRGLVRRALQRKVLRYLAVVVQLAATSRVEIELFRLPRISLSNMAFLTLARAMLEKATAHKEELVRRGLPEGVLREVAAGIAEFEQTLEATSAGRREHVGAGVDLRSVMAQISKQVQMLDSIVRYRFGDNAELMGAWESARSVFGATSSTPGQRTEVKPAA